MDLQQYLHEGLKKMFVGKVINIQTKRISDRVSIQDVEVEGDLIVLKTDKYDTCEIKLSLSTNLFSPFFQNKYSIKFMPEKMGWTSHGCDKSVEVEV